MEDHVVIRKGSYALLPTIMLCAASLFAQSERKPEIFVGYSNLQAEGLPNRNNPNNFFSTSFLNRRGTMHGGNVEGTLFPFQNFGITGDLSFNRQSRSADFNGGENSEKTDIAYFLAGPSYRLAGTDHFAPFVRIMAGAGHLAYRAETKLTGSGGTLSNSFEAGTTDFAMAFGAGLDIKVSDQFKVRVLQIDYAPIFLADRSIAVLNSAGALLPFTLIGQRQDNFRFSFGVTF